MIQRETVIEVLVGAAVAAYTGHGLSQKANRIAQALERQAAAMDRAYPEPRPPHSQKELLKQNPDCRAWTKNEDDVYICLPTRRLNMSDNYAPRPDSAEACASAEARASEAAVRSFEKELDAALAESKSHE